MLRSLAALLGVLLVSMMPASATAGERAVVVELFTSQGCSSCPPADRILAKMAERDDIVALALHVDYWDYIGWKDSFADPAYTARQRAYAHKAGRRMVYTPQMIIDGVEHVEGADPMKILDAVEDRRKAPVLVRLELERRGERLTIRARRVSELREPVAVHLVRFEPSRTVRITRGENRGKTLSYANIVTSWQTLRSWDGRAPLVLEVGAPGEHGVAVILQHPGPGRIVAAAKLP